MIQLGAKRKNLAHSGTSVIVGDFWVVPNHPVVSIAHEIMENVFPSTKEGIAIPTWEAKKFTKLCRCIYSKNLLSGTDKL